MKNVIPRFNIGVTPRIPSSLTSLLLTSPQEKQEVTEFQKEPVNQKERLLEAFESLKLRLEKKAKSFQLYSKMVKFFASENGDFNVEMACGHKLIIKALNSHEEYQEFRKYLKRKGTFILAVVAGKKESISRIVRRLAKCIKLSLSREQFRKNTDKFYDRIPHRHRPQCYRSQSRGFRSSFAC
ncbi:MAG: hypothetical protein M3Q80_02490 [bacterium]|nr:hypothetical protein [bacterium]